MKLESPYEGPWGPIRSVGTNVADWRYQRPVIRVGKCCQCGLCYIYCPTGSIRDMGNYFAADLDYCKGCGICSRICPVRAIEVVREEWE